MAKKKSENATEDAAVETVEVTDGESIEAAADETTVDGDVQEDGTAEDSNIVEVAAEAAPEEYSAYAYVGPTIPKTSLRSKMILRGTLTEIKQFYGAELEAYPQIEKLLVPVHKLAVYARRATTPGNITNKHYSDLASAIRRRREE